MRRLAFVGVLGTALALVPIVQARGEGGTVRLTTVAAVEAEVVNDEGQKEVVLVNAARVIPGDQVIYTIHYTNAGSETADNVFITNPIPEHMVYVQGTAEGTGTVITFSVDGGGSYARPEELTVLGSDGEERPAGARDYTHIRWTLEGPLAPDQSEHVSFRAQLE